MFGEMLSKAELDNVCTKVLELKDIRTVFFFNIDGDILYWKTNAESPVFSKDEIEKTALTRVQMVYELVRGFCTRVGSLELFAFHCEHYNAFIMPLNEISLVCSTEKTAQDPIIKKVRKLVARLV